MPMLSQDTDTTDTPPTATDTATVTATPDTDTDTAADTAMATATATTDKLLNRNPLKHVYHKSHFDRGGVKSHWTGFEILAQLKLRGKFKCASYNKWLCPFHANSFK